MKKSHLDRRTFLKAGGAMIMLPFLEAMIPLRATAASVIAGIPIRTAFLVFPWGSFYDSWLPVGLGAAYQFPTELQGLQAYRSDITMLSNLTQNTLNPDAPGVHAREFGTFLSCAVNNPSLTDIRSGISADQYIANLVASQTRVRSINMTYRDHGGKGDSVYSSYYTKTLSWATNTTAAPRVNSPAEAFDALFAGGAVSTTQTNAEAAKIRAYKKSILDSTKESLSSLTRELGKSDRVKMDQYLTSIREVEIEINSTPLPTSTKQCNSGVRTDSAVFATHTKLMLDLMVIAFQCDLTRVITNRMSSGDFSFLGVIDNHHLVSHYSLDPSYAEKYKKIIRWYVGQYAYLLGRMKAITEPNGKTLLDNSMLLFGSGMQMGANSHTTNRLTLLLAGKAGGQILSGRAIMPKTEVRFANVYMAMLKIMGYAGSSFGNSNGIADLA
ncbi:MAG: DUF1552 domain-containing protein [Pseudomonadota bacterium]|nr:DUF1552 domain-containing protein [Pseudomonadota bacterium]